jgi:hypothetical protein
LIQNDIYQRAPESGSSIQEAIELARDAFPSIASRVTWHALPVGSHRRAGSLRLPHSPPAAPARHRAGGEDHADSSQMGANPDCAGEHFLTYRVTRVLLPVRGPDIYLGSDSRDRGVGIIHLAGESSEGKSGVGVTRRRSQCLLGQFLALSPRSYWGCVAAQSVSNDSVEYVAVLSSREPTVAAPDFNRWFVPPLRSPSNCASGWLMDSAFSAYR